MPTPDELRAWRDGLLAARFSGTREVQAGERRVQYRSDAELAAALAEVDRLLAAPPGADAARPTVIRFHTSKGL